ncbi:hypothetical protein EC957_008336 [Mortierella hygrophila]|uniref:SUN domain-containing protein n=1 Tax=Mortierella hygrophila TaxID=979708 RepID=A0A9P6K5M6_9FUNG|nr:hypothetical protein EC957_008336 [Mortierella hygrophila]
MTEPATPTPSTGGLFTDYREPSPSTETAPPTPYDHDDSDDDDAEGSCRDYYEENMMVELLERRRELYARTRSLNPSTVRVSYPTPSPPPWLVDDPSESPTEATGTIRRSRSSSTPLYGRRRGRVSNKMAAHGGDNCDSYDNKIRTRRSTTNAMTELWSWVRGLCLRLGLRCSYTPEETTIDATAGAARNHYRQVHYYTGKVATTYYNNEAAIIKWILISLLIGLIMTFVPCLIVPQDESPSYSPSTLRYCDRLNLSWRTPVVIVDTGGVGLGSGGGVRRTVRGRDEGSWRSSLRSRWTRTRSAFHLPTHFFSTSRTASKDRHPHHQSPTNDILDPTSIRSPTDRLSSSSSDVGMDLRTEYESLVRRITNLERSQRNRNVDFRLIHEQLRSGRWVEDKILEVIRNELPAELVLAKDPISGEARVPEEFWDAVKEILGARDGYLSAVVQEEMRRTAEGEKGKWEEILKENENRIRSLVSDTHNKLSRRTAVLSRHEFLYLVVTESNAVWASLEGRVDSFVQRQLAQWVEREMDGGGSGVQGVISRVEQQILTEVIDRAIERYHVRHSIHRHIDAQPDYALYNSGGRIIPHLTTQTYHRYKPTTILGRLFGLQNWIPPPLPPSPSDSDQVQVNKVIQPEMNPGDCWPMQGGWGQVAIQLAKRIVVTEIVIEHVDPRVALHRGTAPRDIEIWRLAAPTTESSSSSSTEEEEVRRRLTNDEDAGETPILATWHKFGSPFPGASLLATITYQQQQQQPVGACDRSGHEDRVGEAETEIDTAQRFTIPLSKQNVPAYGVVVRVLTNWGHPDFTCLYRVRVHGRTV